MTLGVWDMMYMLWALSLTTGELRADGSEMSLIPKMELVVLKEGLE